jgi:hypothetical protein
LRPKKGQNEIARTKQVCGSALMQVAGTETPPSRPLFTVPFLVFSFVLFRERSGDELFLAEMVRSYRCDGFFQAAKNGKGGRL